MNNPVIPGFVISAITGMIEAYRSWKRRKTEEKAKRKRDLAEAKKRVEAWKAERRRIAGANEASRAADREAMRVDVDEDPY